MTKYSALDMIKDLEVAFFPMRGDEFRLKGFRELIQKSLREYGEDVIKSACETMRRTRKSKTFPALAEILDACEKERRIYQGNSITYAEPVRPGDSVQEYIFREEKFNDLVAQRHQVLVNAAKDYWIGGAFSYYIKVGRLPRSSAEIESCKTSAKEFQDSYEECVRGGWPCGKLTKGLERLGGAVHAKTERLRSLLLPQDLG